MYDTKFATPVSKAEVTMDNDAYQVVTDPSAFVRFKAIGEIAGEKDVNLLAWTTTPWTLPANLALAVSQKMKYGIYEVGGEKLILATELAEKVFADQENKLIKTISGKDLKGIHYEPLIETVSEKERKSGTYTVHTADFVSNEDGTGIVHIAPAYGEDDYALGQKEDVDFVDCLDDNGYYLPEMAEKLHELGVRDTDEHGIEIWAGNKFIAKILEEKGIVYKIEYIKHEYPFNPRSKQRIMYRAFPSWFFDVDGSKPLMLEQNENINWFPDHLKHGRFAKNIEAAPDWNLSRDRFWATAMPVWKGDKGTIKVVGSYDELYELSGKKLEDYHRPWVDEIEFDIDGEHFKRIEKVLDCWFESGSMPFAQMHYPFENEEKFEAGYPADFIVEYVGQVRAWFYYVHTVNTALASIGAFGKDIKDSKSKNAYKNVITTGTLAGNDGRKMSKSLGNYTDPNQLIDQYSADSYRLLLISSPVLAGEDFALLDKDVSDTARKISMIWNVYDFFATYANVDGWEPQDLPKDLKNSLDIWIVSRVHMLRDEITEGMEEYNLPKATAGILPFVDDLSNWFVRRSRRRFWKSEDSADKNEAYATLYYVMLYLSKIIAPFAPFMAEELYHNLTGLTGDSDSVHLLDWPEAGEVDVEIVEKMSHTRDIISEGLALRMQKSDTEEQIKVRQPLALFVYDGDQLPEEYEQMIADEVNVKKVEHGSETKLDKTLTEVLKKEGFARELIRVVQSARKKAGLNVDDRIKLYVGCELDEEFREIVANETLATELYAKADEKNYSYDEIVKVEGDQITISLEKA